MNRMITPRRRAYAILSALVLVGLALSIADSLLLVQNPCETCGKEMQPFEDGSSIYRCECGFMVDAGYQR